MTEWQLEACTDCGDSEFSVWTELFHQDNSGLVRLRCSNCGLKRLVNY